MMIRAASFAVAAAALGGLVAFGTPAHADPDRHVSWSGTIDDTVDVYIHNKHVWTQTVAGRGVWDVNKEVLGRLPDHPVRVWLDQREGRGDLHVIQQPSPDNNFTAIVRVSDPQPGPFRYHFDLTWRRDGPGAGGPGDHDWGGGPGGGHDWNDHNRDGNGPPQ